MPTYRIGQRESVMHDGHQFIEGEILPSDLGLSPAWIEEAVERGVIVEVGGTRDRKGQDFGTDPETIPVPTDITDDGRVLRMKEGRPQGKLPQGKLPQGKWMTPAKDLMGKSLGDLNLMVARIDHNIPAFETKDEAIAQLSQDLRG